MAVGLHDVLGVGELVELIDVGLGNHDVDGRDYRSRTGCLSSGFRLGLRAKVAVI